MIIVYVYYCSSLFAAGVPLGDRKATSGWLATRETSVALQQALATPLCDAKKKE